MMKFSFAAACTPLLRVVVAALAIAVPQLVRAAIEEIVVTAQKREESVQDVPISVSAFDAQAMEARQIDTFSDLQFNVPNVSYSKTFFSGNNFQIRGIGTLLTASSADSGVAMHVNDVYLNSPLIFETEYYDMEQVEILRGPQGTLFGRNATGGAVNMKTARPEMGELYGNVEGQFGNYDHMKLKGAINIPLGEKVAARIAGIILDRDGYTEDVLTGDDIDGRDQWSVRGSLRFDIADGTRLDIIGHTFEEDSNRSRRQKQLCNRDPSAILGCTPDGTGFGAVNQFATFGTLVASNLFLGPLGMFNFFDQSTTADNPTDLRKQKVFYQPEYAAEEDFLMAEFSHDLTDTINWTLIGAMQQSDILSRQGDGTVQDADGAVIPPGLCTFSPAACTYFGLEEGGPAFVSAVANADTSLGAIAGGNEFDLNTRGAALDLSRIEAEQWSVETRFTTSFSGPVNFLLAGYYLEYESQTDYFVQAPGLDYGALVLANGAFTGNPDAFVSLAPGFFQSETDPFELESLGIFGEMYWDINDRIKLTVGLRYTEDQKSIRDRQILLNVPVLVNVADGSTSFLGSDGSQTPVTTIDELISAAAAVGDYAADPNAPGSAFREEDVSFDEITGRIVLDWKPDLSFTDDTLVYFSFSRGYKGGGINPPIDTTLFPNTPTSFDPEKINAYEVGTKSTFWGNRARVNAAAFYYDYTGLQIGKIINRTSLNENTDAKIFGAEAEILLQPNENWQFNAQFSYLDTELGETETIDPRDPTQGRQDVTLVKDILSASHCVVEWNGQVPLSQNPAAVGTISGAGAPYFPTGEDLGGFGGPPGVVIPTTSNVPDSAFSACEAVQAVAPLFGYNYLDAVGVNLKGNELISAPKFTASLSAQHTWFMGGGMSLTTRVDYYWQDEFFSTTFNRPQDLQDSWDMVNAQVQLNGRDDRWYARAFVQNLGDEDNVTGTTEGDPSTGLGTSIFLVEPQLYGLTLGVRLN